MVPDERKDEAKKLGAPCQRSIKTRLPSSASVAHAFRPAPSASHNPKRTPPRRGFPRSSVRAATVPGRLPHGDIPRSVARASMGQASQPAAHAHRAVLEYRLSEHPSSG